MENKEPRQEPAQAGESQHQRQDPPQAAQAHSGFQQYQAQHQQYQPQRFRYGTTSNAASTNRSRRQYDGIGDAPSRFEQMKDQQMPAMVVASDLNVAPHRVGGDHMVPHRFGGDQDHGFRQHPSERDYTRAVTEETGI